jgi:hypothetical protein
MSVCLGQLAEVSARQGEWQRAARLFAAAEVLRRTVSASLAPAERVDLAESVAAIRAALGEEAFSQAWSEGRAMSLEEAVAYALEEETGHPSE